MTKIGNVEIEGFLVLAPMAGVTDIAFRQICRENGAALSVSEMVSSRALLYQDAKSLSLLKAAENENPFSVQIFGNDADIIAQAAVKAIAVSGAQILDINMGCPMGKVVKNGDGAALMLEPEKVRDVVSKVRRATDAALTVKIRKGWDGGNVNAVEIAKIAEDAGADAIAVHGRTRVQMYAGRADWDIIKKVKQSVKIPVIANGDVFEPEDAKRILNYTGADLAMIGRGSLGNPWLFSRGNAAIEGKEIPPLPPLCNRCDTALRQFEIAMKFKSEKIACLEARKHYAWYLKGVPHASYFREKISKITTMEDIEKITEGIKRELR